MPSPKIIKTFLYTVAVVSITIGGSLYGAELKSKTETRETNEKLERASLDEKIGALRSSRAALVAKKIMVEKQIQDLETKIEKKRRKNMQASPPASGASSSKNALSAEDLPPRRGNV